MKIQQGPAFGAAIIGVGLAFLLYQAGKPVWVVIGAAMTAALADYAVLIFLKSKSLDK